MGAARLINSNWAETTKYQRWSEEQETKAMIQFIPWTQSLSTQESPKNDSCKSEFLELTAYLHQEWRQRSHLKGRDIASFIAGAQGKELKTAEGLCTGWGPKPPLKHRTHRERLQKEAAGDFQRSNPIISGARQSKSVPDRWVVGRVPILLRKSPPESWSKEDMLPRQQGSGRR